MFCTANDTFCTANFTYCTGLELIDVLLANQNEDIVACISLSNKTLSTSLLSLIFCLYLLIRLLIIKCHMHLKTFGCNVKFMHNNRLNRNLC